MMKPNRFIFFDSPSILVGIYALIAYFSFKEKRFLYSVGVESRRLCVYLHMV